MHPYPLVHSDDDNCNDKVSRSTIDLSCDRNNVSIILDPVAAMEEMETQKQRRTMIRITRPSLEVRFSCPSVYLSEVVYFGYRLYDQQ